MLQDPNIDDRTKEEIKRSSALIGGHLSQIMGGVYNYNLDGTHTYRKPRQSAVTAARVKVAIRTDSPEIRNELNVSININHRLRVVHHW